MLVNMASGHEMISTHQNSGFMWEINDMTFIFNLHWLKVKGCDIVLGMDWIDSVTPILLHTNPRNISFFMNGDMVTLFGRQPNAQVSPASAKTMMKLLHSSYCSFVAQAQLNVIEDQSSILAQIEEVMYDYQELFIEPKGLLPSREYDHAIELVHGAKVVNQRHYHYSYEPKNVIEKFAHEM